MCRYFSIVLSFFVLDGCIQNNSKPDDLPRIRVSENFRTELLLSELVKIDSILVIGTGTANTLGEVRHVWPLGDKLIIHSAEPPAVSLLAEDGKIGTQLFPDFRLHEITGICLFDNDIYVLDRYAKKIHRFNNHLEWQQEFRIPVFAQSIKMLTPEKVILYTGNEVTEHNRGKVVFYDLVQGKVFNDLLPVSDKQKRYFNFLTTYHFPASADEIFFWDSAIDELYKIEENGIRPVYYIDYGKWSLPEKFYQTAEFDNAYDFVTELRQLDYAFRHFKFLTNEDFFLLSFEKSGDFLSSVYSRSTGQSKTFARIKDDIFFTEAFDEIKLQFFVNLVGRDQFIAFMPGELLSKRKQVSKGLPATSPVGDILVFGRLKVPQ